MDLFKIANHKFFYFLCITNILNQLIYLFIENKYSLIINDWLLWGILGYIFGYVIGILINKLKET